MTCKSCEERRLWVKQQYDRAKERTAKAINRIRGIANQDSRAEHNADSTDSSEGSDSSNGAGTEQRTTTSVKRSPRGRRAKEKDVGLLIIIKAYVLLVTHLSSKKKS